MENRYKLKYDIKERCISNIKFMQGDIDSSILEVQILDNSVPVDITGENIEFRFLKPDGTKVSQNNSTGVKILDVENGIVECTLKANTLAAVGNVRAEIIRKKEGHILTCPSFNFVVNSSIGSMVLSSNYIVSIENKLIEWQLDENLRQKRFENNENTRQSTFDSNETARQNEFDTNESNRKTEYDSLKKVIIGENAAADLQDQVNKVNTHLADMANDKLSKITKKESVFSLPNCTSGQLNFSMRGRTLKNELNYNTETWEKWDKTDGVTGDNTGLEFIADNENYRSAYLNTNVKSLTNYGLILYIVSQNLSKPLEIYSKTFKYSQISPKVGYIKAILLTRTDTGRNTFSIQIRNDELSGNKIKIKDIRLFELPTNSEIENDFNTLTADELNAKYPFHSGIWSCGEGQNKIEVLMHGKNLFSEDLIPLFKYTFGSTSPLVWENNKIGRKNGGEAIWKLSLKVKANTQYYLSRYISEYVMMGLGNTSTFSKISDSQGNLEIVIYFSVNSTADDYIDNIQLEEGTKATDYVKPQQDKIDILMQHTFGIGSSIDNKGQINYRTGKTIINGSNEDWTLLDNLNEKNKDILTFRLESSTVNDKMKYKYDNSVKIICDKLPNVLNYISSGTQMKYYDESCAIYYNDTFSARTFFVNINKNKLSTPDANGLNDWLSKNNLTVYYKSAEPIVEQLPQPLALQSFKGGSMIVNSTIPPQITVNYPTSFATGIFENAKGVADNRSNIKSIYDALYLLTLEVEKIKENKTEEV